MLGFELEDLKRKEKALNDNVINAQKEFDNSLKQSDQKYEDFKKNIYTDVIATMENFGNQTSILALKYTNISKYTYSKNKKLINQFDLNSNFPSNLSKTIKIGLNKPPLNFSKISSHTLLDLGSNLTTSMKRSNSATSQSNTNINNASYAISLKKSIRNNGLENINEKSIKHIEFENFDNQSAIKSVMKEHDEIVIKKKIDEKNKNINNNY